MIFEFFLRLARPLPGLRTSREPVAHAYKHRPMHKLQVGSRGTTFGLQPLPGSRRGTGIEGSKSLRGGFSRRGITGPGASCALALIAHFRVPHPLLSPEHHEARCKLCAHVVAHFSLGGPSSSLAGASRGPVQAMRSCFYSLSGASSSFLAGASGGPVEAVRSRFCPLPGATSASAWSSFSPHEAPEATGEPGGFPVSSFPTGTSGS